MEGKWGTLSATERDDGREEGESGPGWAVMNSDGDEGGSRVGCGVRPPTLNYCINLFARLHAKFTRIRLRIVLVPCPVLLYLALLIKRRMEFHFVYRDHAGKLKNTRRNFYVRKPQNERDMKKRQVWPFRMHKKVLLAQTQHR